MSSESAQQSLRRHGFWFCTLQISVAIIPIAAMAYGRTRKADLSKSLTWTAPVEGLQLSLASDDVAKETTHACAVMWSY